MREPREKGCYNRRRMPLGRPRALVVALVVAGCTQPNYGNGHLQCAAGNVCPSGFFCASDQHCWRSGSGPPATEDLAVGSGADLASASFDLATGPADLASVAPSTCGSLGASVLFCDGFENAQLNGWSSSTSNGVAARDTS